MVVRGAAPRRKVVPSRQNREYTKTAGRMAEALARMDVRGGMVKLVYTEALKASSPQGECGFDSHSRYQHPAESLQP